MFSIVQRKDRLSGGTAPQDGTGRLPGKPEQNAVPMKGDTMAITRAGNGFPTPVDKHHIFSVHTAVPSKGAAGVVRQIICTYILHIKCACISDGMDKHSKFLHLFAQLI